MCSWLADLDLRCQSAPSRCRTEHNPAIQEYLAEAGKGNMLLTSVSVGNDSEANQLTSYGNASRLVWIASAYASFSVRGAPGTKGPRGQGVSKSVGRCGCAADRTVTAAGGSAERCSCSETVHWKYLGYLGTAFAHRPPRHKHKALVRISAALFLVPIR